ncbi:hypothetical protein MRB53_016533 [Persea americana]|uniref:Uncharacterized protein n=1 Tax=Persea americana TaxID=3435 RepID=A0ACC2M3E2_PERAE|nr:hypothetical protein MRB53_016533 [Persea americana]
MIGASGVVWYLGYTPGLFIAVWDFSYVDVWQVLSNRDVSDSQRCIYWVSSLAHTLCYCKILYAPSQSRSQICSNIIETQLIIFTNASSKA